MFSFNKFYFISTYCREKFGRNYIRKMYITISNEEKQDLLFMSFKPYQVNYVMWFMNTNDITKNITSNQIQLLKAISKKETGSEKMIC